MKPVEDPRSGSLKVEDVEQVGQGAGDGRGIDKETGGKGLVEIWRKQFSGVDQRDEFLEWKEVRKLEDMVEEIEAKKGRNLGADFSSDRAKSGNLKSINLNIYSKFRGGDPWTPGGQVREGGEGAVSGGGGVQARINTLQRARREGVVTMESNAAAGLG